MRKMLEDSSILVHSVDVEVRFLDQSRTGPGPIVHVSLPELALRSTNRKGEIVPLNEAREQGTVGNMVTIWKRVDIGCLTVVFENKDFRQAMCMLQPTSATFVMRRRLGGKLPTEIHLSLPLPLVTLSWDRRLWETTMEILTAVIWCLNEKDVTKRREADSTVTSMLEPVQTPSPVSGAPGENPEVNAALQAAAAAERDKEVAGSISMEEMIKFPVVHLEVHVEKFMVVFRDIAELQVENCAMSVVFDHKDYSDDGASSRPEAAEPKSPSEHDIAEGYTYKNLDWDVNKELKVQLSVLSVSCKSLIPRQNRMSVVKMNQEEQFLSAAFTVRPFMLFSRPNNSDPAAVEGKILLGDISLIVPFDLFKGFFELATCFMPNRPPLPMNSQVMDNTFWWIDNSSITMKARGIHLSMNNADQEVPVTLFFDIDNGTASTTREEKLLSGYLNPEIDYQIVESEQISYANNETPDPYRLLRGEVVLKGLRLGLKVGSTIYNIVESTTTAAHFDWFRPLAFLQSVLFPREVNGTNELSGHSRSVLPALGMRVVLPAVSLVINQALFVDAHKLIAEFVEWGKENAAGIFEFIMKQIQDLVLSIEDHSDIDKKSVELKCEDKEKALVPVDKSKETGSVTRRLVRFCAKAHSTSGTVTGSCSGKAVAEGLSWLRTFVPTSTFYGTLEAIMNEVLDLVLNAFDPSDVFDFLKFSIGPFHFNCYYGPDSRDLAMKQSINITLQDFSGDISFGKVFPLALSFHKTASSMDPDQLKLQRQQSEELFGGVHTEALTVDNYVMDTLRKSSVQACNLLEIRTSNYVGQYSLFLQPFIRLAVMETQMEVQGDIPSLLGIAKCIRTNWQDAFSSSCSMNPMTIPKEIRQLHDAVVLAASEAGYMLRAHDQLKTLLGVLISLEVANVSVALIEHPDAIVPGTRRPAMYVRLTPPSLEAEMCFAQFHMQEVVERAKDELRNVVELSTEQDNSLFDESENTELGLELAKSLRATTEKQLIERRIGITTLEKTKKFLQTTLDKVESENAQLEQTLVGDSDTVNDMASAASANVVNSEQHTDEATSMLAAGLGGEVARMLMINQSLAAEAQKNLLEQTRVACERAEDARKAAAHAASHAKQMELCRKKRAAIQDNLNGEIQRLKARIAQQKAELQAYNQMAKHEEAVKARLQLMRQRESQLEEILSKEPQQTREEQTSRRQTDEKD